MTCQYTFAGTDGKQITIKGIPAFKAYLATGGLEHLTGITRDQIEKGIRYAEAVRSNERQVSEAGATTTPSGREGGEDLQRQQASEGEAGNAQKQVRGNRLRQFKDDRLYIPGTAERLNNLRREFGWAEKGGYLLREYSDEDIYSGEVVGRTKWIPHSELWPGRPDTNLKISEANTFVDDALAGRPMPVKGHRFVSYLLDTIDAVEQAEITEINDLLQELYDEQQAERSQRAEEEAIRSAQAYEDQAIGERNKSAEFSLTGQTTEQIKAADAERAQQAKDEKQAEQKRKAALAVDDFMLTGSSRTVDELEARGQGNLFDVKRSAATNRQEPIYTKESLRQQLSASLNGISKGLGEAILSLPNVNIINEADNPNAVGAKAFVEGDQVYFVADNIGADDNLAGLAKHEIAVHAMQLGRDSAGFQSILSAMRESDSASVKAAYAAVPEGTAKNRIDEEALGYLLEASPKSTIAQRFVSWLKDMIRSIGKALPVLQRAKFFQWANNLTPSDLNVMAESALRGGEINSDGVVGLVGAGEFAEGGVKQSEKVVTTVDDARYMDAVKRGDMETLRQMVEEAAVASGAVILDDSASTSYRVRRAATPKKTEKAYKLFATKKTRPGEIFPLFVGNDTAVPQGVWLDAIAGSPAADSKTGKPKVKSKLGPLAYRPGWHAGDLPFASHIGVKDENGKIWARKDNEVWAEVEVIADIDYQPEADSNGVTKDGKYSVALADIKHMPVDGMYRYKTNANMTGNWIISGSTKINKILSEQEVNALLTDAGITPMPWESGALDLASMGLNNGSAKTPYKILDPVTYDDNGNVIPLSQRFNKESQDIRYSLSSTAAAIRNITRTFSQDSSNGFNFLHKSISTSLHKAEVNPEFKKVFNQAMSFENNITHLAVKPSEMAPNLLPDASDWRAALDALKPKGRADRQRMDAVSKAVFDGTTAGGSVFDGRNWTDQELIDKFSLDEKGIELYKEFQVVRDRVLLQTATALAYRNARPFLKKPMDTEQLVRDPDSARDSLTEDLGMALQVADTDEQKNSIQGAITEVRAIFDKAQKLSDAGYAPLMRFGRFAVDVLVAGERREFRKFETDIEAKMYEAEARERFGAAAEITRSAMSEKAYTLFQGVDPDVVLAFAENVDPDVFGADNEVMQEWYKTALQARSAFKSMIHRKGIAGYDTNLRRIAASFVTSNARMAANQYHTPEMTRIINDMQKRKVAGDVVDEAIRLRDYIAANDEPFKAMKGVMFAWYLGGSVASAAVNLTQPVMMTLPYLSQWGIGKASSAMSGSVKEAMSGKVEDADLRAALQMAGEDGKVAPASIHHLYHEGMSSIIDKLPIGKTGRDKAQAIATLWGYMFGAAENFNRRLTFIAAYRMASEDSSLGNPYDFAVRAVDQTQGIMSKANRPNWARGTGAFGAVGVAAFTFKQYSIAYVELLTRMLKSGSNGKKGAAMMVGMLLLASGLQGAPGADDLEDLLDTLLQYGGYEGNSRLWLKRRLVSMVGDDVAQMMQYGVLSKVLPIDIGQRIGLGNLLPGTTLLKPSETNRARQVFEFIGPTGSFAAQVSDALLSGESGGGVMGIARAFTPIAIKNALYGLDMYSTGLYRDMAGRKVTDVDASDAFAKALGFQPEAVAEETRPQRLIQMTAERVKQVQGNINALFAQAIFEKNPELRKKAEEKLKDWNENYPSMKIRRNDSAIMRRVKEMQMEKVKRLLKSLPKGMRSMAKEELGGDTDE